MSRAALIAAPVAVLATVSAVSFGVITQSPEPTRELLAHTVVPAADATPVRAPSVSRSKARVAAAKKEKVKDRKADKAGLARKASEASQARKAGLARQAARELEQEAEATRIALRQADTRLWATEDLNIWTGPSADADQVGVLEAGERVLVTGRKSAERQEIVLDGRSRWVTAGYLDDEKPVAGIGGACTNGSSVPSGVDPNVTKVHQAVCAAFPDVTSYGTFRNDGEHGQGRAVDIMISGERGWEIAEFVRANYVALGVEYLIYAQKIWSVERGGEGWRGMSDRGSTTANHYDHVHVTVY
ncbi:SH3 domain-containing protein [Nocardioides sp. 616]|uniref:SH3 domain-containing protein n=1 Tax=Nocardioides sp. 616 TaxID=2268090 RepID=UPI0013B3ADBE|nr:SH3 domain-containing protein [Nocardioides sp. 616]